MDSDDELIIRSYNTILRDLKETMQIINVKHEFYNYFLKYNRFNFNKK